MQHRSSLCWPNGIPYSSTLIKLTIIETTETTPVSVTKTGGHTMIQVLVWRFLCEPGMILVRIQESSDDQN